MQDHFTKPSLDTSLWAYYNMGSPCYQVPERAGDSEIKLYEYDKFNEGNCLLSRRFVGQRAKVSAVVTGFEDPDNGGACVGFYGGNGAFTDYVLLAASPKRLEIRVPSGAQRGASFMDAGQPQTYAVASADYAPHFPMELALERDGTRSAPRLDGREVLRGEAYALPGDARALIKAHPREGERYTPHFTTFDWAAVEGEVPQAELSGRVLGEDGQPVEGASVHVAGFDDHFALTDADGVYRLNGLPRGEQVVVAAAEGCLFEKAGVRLVSGADNCLDITLKPETADNIPRREYNNPSFDRSMNGFLCLNGTWQFQFDPENVGEARQWYLPNAPRFGKAIRVPFSWASLMGFGEEFLVSGDANHEANTAMNNFNVTGKYAWYRRSFVVPDGFPENQHIVLHIGACTAVTNAWLDGRYLGMRVDEYSDLTFDLGKLAPESRHTLVVKAEYPHDVTAHNMGKQIFWFSSAPGIWQSVWIEPRNEAYIDSVQLRPELEFDGEALVKASVHAFVRAECAEGMRLLMSLYAPDGSPQDRLTLTIRDGVARCDVAIERPVLWDYLEGNLYTAECSLIDGQITLDNVRTYVGLRKIETRWLSGHSPEETDDPLDQYQYLYLNNRPFYVIGVLDQGYNAFGIYTYRSLEEEGPEGKRGSIAYEVDRTLGYGYNLSRMHIKENEPLWYHECDRRGLLVWTEHPSNFFATPDNPDWQSAYSRELDGMLKRLHNHPSIVLISSINESWGVEGRHVSTPWKNELRYRFLEEAARRIKLASPHVLVCDNSGFGKTGEGDINDFHYYPSDYFDARGKWAQVTKDCYPGSIFNYINAAHGEGHIGSASQSGKPILISEFLHINGIDLQLRMFQKIAGYLRMNVASHEVENSGPLTSDRYERDYGYVDEHMRSLGYGMVNNMDQVVADLNRITHIPAGGSVRCEVYASHFSSKRAHHPELVWSLAGIDALGRYREGIASGRRGIGFEPFRVEKLENIDFTAPSDMRGGYLFFRIEDGENVLCRNYVQFVFDGARCEIENAHPIPPASCASLAYENYGGVYQAGGGSLLWISGRGSAQYETVWDKPGRRGKLVFEAGAREGIDAVKVTDEVKYPTAIDVILDGQRIGTAEPGDDPSDERALFTNDALGGVPFNYRNLGRYGYGERFEIEIPEALLTPGRHLIRFECGQGGMTLYGRDTGRYGFDPCAVIEA